MDVYWGIPKIELHAHLSGCIDKKFLLQNWEELDADDQSHKVSTSNLAIDEDDVRDLEECFEIFKLVHRVVKSPEILRAATEKVIEDFAAENVIYLELRTTIRPLPTCTAYFEAVLNAIQTAPSVISNRIYVKLLPSIDRSRGIEAALCTAELTCKYATLFPDIIVGLDVSGNPSVGNLCEFVPALNLVRSRGLKTTVHMAEISGMGEEWLNFLRLHKPDRIGHGVFLPTNSECNSDANALEAKHIIVESKIPLELCLTSNIRSKSVPSYESHHLQHWINLNHPVCLCTDDTSVLSCTPSGELKIAIERCGLSMEQIFDVLVSSVHMSFCSDELKDILHTKLIDFFKNLTDSKRHSISHNHLI